MNDFKYFLATMSTTQGVGNVIKLMPRVGETLIFGNSMSPPWAPFWREGGLKIV